MTSLPDTNVVDSFLLSYAYLLAYLLSSFILFIFDKPINVLDLVFVTVTIELLKLYNKSCKDLPQ